MPQKYKKRIVLKVVCKFVKRLTSVETKINAN